jgi:heme/copper-type cytochrome/quinol oxidase subunit 2
VIPKFFSQLKRAAKFIAPLTLAIFIAAPVHSDSPPTFYTTIKNHMFDPAEIHVPANKPTILVITNADDTPEEFDSVALRIEKVIAPGKKGAVWIRPLAFGSYSFMGEFHPTTAQGVVIAE